MVRWYVGGLQRCKALPGIRTPRFIAVSRMRILLSFLRTRRRPGGSRRQPSWRVTEVGSATAKGIGMGPVRWPAAVALGWPGGRNGWPPGWWVVVVGSAARLGRRWMGAAKAAVRRRRTQLDERRWASTG